MRFIPFCLMANTGTTNTGAIDALEALADICAVEGIWLHADGAYGAAALFSTKGRELLRGIERADSFSLDPHKWLFQPFDCALLMLRLCTINPRTTEEDIDKTVARLTEIADQMLSTFG